MKRANRSVVASTVGHLPVMVPDPEVATPLRLWASQEKVLVLFKPGQKHKTTSMCEVGTFTVF